MNTFQILLPEFLPSVSFFLPFLKSKTILIADHIQYKKRSNLTRSGVLKNNLQLTIPVKNTGFKKAVCEKEIAYIENWTRKHLTSIYHRYHILPYFDDYFSKMEKVYKKHHAFLNHFLYDLIKLFASQLKINCDLRLSSQEGFNERLEDGLIRFSKNNASAIFIYHTQDAKSGYIDLHKFDQKGIITQALSNSDNTSFKFTNVLDFLFNYGPEAAIKIREG